MTDYLWRDFGKRVVFLGLGTACMWYALTGGKENHSNQVTYFRLTPHEMHLERMKYRETLEDNLNNSGMMNEIQQFYYRDMGEAISLSGVMHNAGGIAGAFAFGISRSSNKLLGLLASYTFAMVPEIYNIYQGNLTGKDIFTEGGKDAVLVLGAFGIGKLLRYLADSRKSEGYTGRFENVVNTGRPWWNE